MSLSKHFAFSAVLALSLCATQSQAATITPNITTDPALVGPDTGTDCSLRYAIESINTGDFEGGCGDPGVSTGLLGTDDTVVLGPNTYTLTLSGEDDNNATGDVDVQENAVIEGAGSGSTTVDASGIAAGDRAFEFYYLANEISLTGVTVTGGDVTLTDFEGGGLNISAQNVTLEDVRVVGNFANSGGGIFTEEIEGEPVVLINNSTIADNEAVAGGGIYILEGIVGISNSTISGNDAVDGSGGGISVQDSSLFLTNSTISTNTAVGEGGGLFFNENLDNGAGGIGSIGGLKGAYNVTIVFNEANVGGGMASNEEINPEGGGGLPAKVFNSIVAENTASSGTGMDCANGNYETGGFNLIGQISPNDNCFNFVDGVSGDQVGSSASPINPLVAGLADNGGPTLTHALETGSPAIDRGNPDGCQALDVPAFIDDSDNIIFNDLTTDQRGEPRPVAVLDPNDPICDIGAYELQVAEPTPTPTPTATPVPPFNGFIEGSGCSLTAGAASAQSLGLLGLVAGWCAWALRRRFR